MMLDLPPNFIQTIQNTFQGKGQHWLESLPDLLEEASHRWGLTDIQPVSNLSYNFVALALSGASDSERSRRAAQSIRPSTTPPHSPWRAVPGRASGSAQERVVLKLGVPNRELTSEIAALRLYDGRGACRLIGCGCRERHALA